MDKKIYCPSCVRDGSKTCRECEMGKKFKFSPDLPKSFGKIPKRMEESFSKFVQALSMFRLIDESDANAKRRLVLVFNKKGDELSAIELCFADIGEVKDGFADVYITEVLSGSPIQNPLHSRIAQQTILVRK